MHIARESRAIYGRHIAKYGSKNGKRLFLGHQSYLSFSHRTARYRLRLMGSNIFMLVSYNIETFAETRYGNKTFSPFVSEIHIWFLRRIINRFVPNES